VNLTIPSISFEQLKRIRAPRLGTVLFWAWWVIFAIAVILVAIDTWFFLTYRNGPLYPIEVGTSRTDNTRTRVLEAWRLIYTADIEHDGTPPPSIRNPFLP